ncbi:MAG TPA: virulence protein RhuM/Fic/DOC family protein [Atopobiaceae bacterium]|nr:virulence protein RhuM/Fic/DOC family protein [Atopobiaceae bacterium]
MSATEIILFESSDGVVTLPVEVDVSHNEVWLTQAQMGILFDTTKQNISLHLNNCFRDGELERTSVVKESLTTAGDGKGYRTASYSLDAIISVGYRVKSQRGVEFRRWATDVLRRYLIDGYAENRHRLRELGKVANIISRLPEGDVSMRQVLDIMQSYARALDLLDDYDHQSISKPEGKHEAYVLSYEECCDVIAGMRFGNESSLFGVEKDDSFHASIGDIYAGLAGQEAYPSVEEKAANLLYFVVKNHSFLDGNKRIAAALFLYFLDRNGMLFNAAGEKLLADEVLVALTIMLAESRPDEKEAMVRLVMNFLCG